MLDFALCRPRVDAPLVGGELSSWSILSAVRGGEDLLTLSPGGKRPHGGSLPFE